MKFKIRLVFYCSLATLMMLSSCKVEQMEFTGPPKSVSLAESTFYSLDLTNRKRDTFKVNIYTEELSSGNDIFQFPSNIPGTYQIADIGRFIQKFKVYDKHGNPITYEWISTNQVKISQPEKVYHISYEARDIWDTEVTENWLYPMASTTLESDHALLNMFGIVGFPTGLKERDCLLELKIPADWTIGTSLEQTADKLYWADTYDEFVDSPLLLGSLTNSNTTLGSTSIGTYAYSQYGHLNSNLILQDIKQVLMDAEAFLGVLPVDRYNFLFLFGEKQAGALEHSYSSVYALADAPYTTSKAQEIRSICAHEFFHIVTPLNIHSEIIEDYNFDVPTPSQHLWLYEGVTEWASDMMQFRNGSMTISDLFSQFSNKVWYDQRYDPNISLTEISKTSFTTGNNQFINVYNRGSLVATLLDIRLLQLSNGTFGLRELILELIDVYGKEQSFSEENFFMDLVNRTYPEIETFITNHIQGTTALPIEEYFLLLGIDYEPSTRKFTELEIKTPEQQMLFEVWSQNLDITQP